MNTGEDIQGLRKILDLTRLISIAILCIHFYLTCYRAFVLWGLTAGITVYVPAILATFCTIKLTTDFASKWPLFMPQSGHLADFQRF